MMGNIAYITGLASHLIYDGLLDYSIVENAYQKAKQQDIHFISYIVKNNILSSHVIFNSCVKTFHLPKFDLEKYDSSWVNNLPLSIDFVHRYHVIPLYKLDGILHLGLSDPTDRSALDAVTFHTGLKVQAVIVPEDKLCQLLEKYFSHHSSKNTLELSLISKLANDDIQHTIQENTVNYDEPLIRFVDNLLQHAINQAVSDIHIEPYQNSCRIRYRQDGILHEVAEIPLQLAARLVVRLKIISKLDISERRIPQDGRFHLLNRDIRINTCPTLFGEKIVLRLLNAENIILDFSGLGFTEQQATQIIKIISQPQGMILVTGPTGSGKTVTLYTALNYLNTKEKNISTVEDPIEIQLKGINQVNIHPKIGLDFSTVLRTFLRQDPDIIMVGEIRDIETAEISIQAAQTGHLVFSTLHTNSAIDTISRLQAMGIASYNIANSISLIIAQRLVRKLCHHCKQPEIISTDAVITLGFDPSQHPHTIYRAIGCPECTHGYHGRIAIYELLPISEQISYLINSNTPSSHILRQAKKENFIPLKKSGFDMVTRGITSITEVNRVL